MISRRSAHLIAEAYRRKFTYYVPGSSMNSYRSSHRVWKDKLYDFLFVNDYSAWFCNAARQSNGERGVQDFMMKIHTGETLTAATQGWSWKSRQKLGQEYLENQAESLLNETAKQQDQYGKRSNDECTNNILKSLELDGYVYRDARLLRPESDVLDAEEEMGVLATLYRELGLRGEESAFHHLRLSETHYLDSKWDDSISNSRKFLECVLAEIAAAHSRGIKREELPQRTLEKPVEVRDYLEREGLIEPKEKEALSKVYGLLSHTGGHPYMASNDQARLLRHLSLTLSQFAMLRYEGAVKAGCAK